MPKTCFASAKLSIGKVRTAEVRTPEVRTPEDFLELALLVARIEVDNGLSY